MYEKAVVNNICYLKTVVAIKDLIRVILFYVLSIRKNIWVRSKDYDLILRIIRSAKQHNIILSVRNLVVFIKQALR